MPTENGAKQGSGGGGGGGGGDITAVLVTAGGLLSGGGASGDVTIASRFDNNLTWTGLHKFNPGTTQATPILLDMAQPSSTGQRDSHSLQWRGTSFDSAGHNADWRIFADVTSDAGASSLVVQTRKDAASFGTVFSVADNGDTVVAGKLTVGALTSGRVVVVGASGLLVDDSDMTFAVDTLTVTKVVASTSLTVSGLTAGRIPFVGASGLIGDSASLTYSATTGALVQITDAGTNTVAHALQLKHASSGTPALGFGTGTRVDLHNAANAFTQASTFETFWAVATAGSEAASVHLHIADGTGTFPATSQFQFTGSSGQLSATALQATGLTSTRIPVAGASGLLGDFSTLTFTSGSGTLSATALQATGLLSGRVPIVGAAGLLGDDADMTFATDTLTVTKIVAASALTNSALTSGRLVVSSTAGLQTDFAALAWNSGTSVLTVSGKISGLTQATATGDAVHAGRLVSTSSGITGGGDHTADRTHTLDLTFAAAWTGAASWTAATLPVTATITDAGAATQIEAARFRHLSSVSGTAGNGCYISGWATNTTPAIAEAGRINFWLRTVVAGTENGIIVFQQNVNGAMTNVAHFANGGLYNVSGPSIGSISATAVTTTLAQWTITSSMLQATSSSAAQGGHSFTGTVNTSGARSFFVITPSSNTATTLSTAVKGFDYQTYTRQWATGAGPAEQAEFVISAPTYSAVAASTFPIATTFAITGAPIAGTNMTITKPLSFHVQAGGAQFDGNIGFYGVAPAAQGTGGQNVTNNVTDSGSTAGTIPDITDGVTYANDYVNLRRALFQLARMLKQDHDWLRSAGPLT